MPEAECWVCKDPANSREHIVKRSDLSAVFGVPKPNQPVFLHNAVRTNSYVQGLNASSLKFRVPLCSKCNNERSQPYDRAWEKFSKFVRERNPPLTPGSYIRADRIFSHSSNEHLRKTQLFFVKLLGCLLTENAVQLDRTTFANSILTGKFHRDVFLKIGCFPREERVVGVSNLVAAHENTTKEVLGASFFYEVDLIAVQVIYTPYHRMWEMTEGAWHPAQSTGRLLVHDFSKL